MLVDDPPCLTITTNSWEDKNVKIDFFLVILSLMRVPSQCGTLPTTRYCIVCNFLVLMKTLVATMKLKLKAII
jgi:hypothetical protein